MVITALDFEGELTGLAVCIPVWFFGGMLVGMISPGRTFIEPRLAALFIAMPTTYLLHASETVHTRYRSFLYIIMACSSASSSPRSARTSASAIKMGPLAEDRRTEATETFRGG